MSMSTERIEYRTRFTYPYLENRGEWRYGPPAGSVEAADSAAMKWDDGYYWAGKTLGHQKRTVIESEWEDVE